MHSLGLDERLAIMFATEYAVDEMGSQIELGEKLGYSQQTVSRYRQIPRAPVGFALALAKHLKSDIPALVNRFRADIEAWKRKNQASVPPPEQFEISDVVRALAADSDWMDSTPTALELSYRALCANGNEPDAGELRKLGDQFDAAARATNDAIELRRFRAEQHARHRR